MTDHVSQGGIEERVRVDEHNYANAMLNILEDSAAEKSRLDAMQRAVMNILEDSAGEKARLADTQRAVLNILEDSEGEKVRLQATQKAVLNVLEDAALEKARQSDTQRAVLNILDDFMQEKARLGATQRAVMNILEDSSTEQARLAETQRAVLNILDDIEIEKQKVEQANVNLRGEIAERERAEEALRRAKASVEDSNKELEAFSYSVAHDLRAPLRSIDGFSLALLEDYGDRMDAEGARYLEYVRTSAQQMGQLIDGLLNLSRVTRAELRREAVDVSELARTVLAKLQSAQPGREVEFLVQPGLVAEADPQLLNVILTNLLSNAWKFTGKRAAGRIEFAAKDGARPATFFVRDNGAGFDAAYAQKLFGVFQRLHTEEEFEGTGIGLVTVKRIVRRHGGQVWAEGQVDQGATFYFTIEEDLT